MPAHHLDQEQPLGCVGGVADLVDGFGGGADGAVKPMLTSVPARSLSIVPGQPITLPGQKRVSSRHPRNVPSPPIATRCSILCRASTSAAVRRPSSVLNRSQRLVCRIVPPRWMMPDTLRRCIW